MSAASNYLENALVNAVLRQQSFTSPSAIFLSLHTADPNETGASEVTTAAWPSYVRMDITKGEVSLADAWTAPDNGLVRNTQQILFPVYNGAGNLTVTHFGLFDASSGGNGLIFAPLDVFRTIIPGDVFVADVEKLTVRVL